MCSSGLEALSCLFSTKFVSSRDLRFTTSPAIATYTLLPHVLLLRSFLSALAKTYSLASFGLRVGLCDLPMCMAFRVVILKSHIYIFHLQLKKQKRPFCHIFLNGVFLQVAPKEHQVLFLNTLPFDF